MVAGGFFFERFIQFSLWRFMMMMVVAMEHVQCLSVRHNNNLIVALSTHSFPHFSFCGYGVNNSAH
jgi:hypothetical protein